MNKLNWSRCGLSIACVAPAAALAAGSPTDIEKQLKDDAIAAIGELLRKEIQTGPFKITVGPQEGGGFGAILKGSGSSEVSWLNSKAPGAEEFARETSMSLRYGTLEFAVDASWSSEAEALNQTTLSLKPEVTWAFLDGGKWATAATDAANKEKCHLVAVEFARRTENTAPLAADAARLRELGLDDLDEAALLGMFQDVQSLNCNTLGDARPPRQKFALGLYPDLRYRFGKFKENNVVHEANQLIYGGGLRLFLPSATISPVFREAPRISVGYYSTHESEDSTVPLPEDIKKNFLLVEARTLIRVPFPGYPIGQSPVQLDFSPSASKSAGGGGDWQMLWRVQLTLSSDGQFLPAITYQSGEEQGLKYDKQLILGFLWQLVQPKKNGA